MSNVNSFRKHATRETHNAGKSLELLGDDGKPCGHFVELYGMDSDAASAALQRFRRERAEYIGTRKAEEVIQTAEYQQWLAEAETRILKASYVKGWSFEEAFTPENVVAMLTECPNFAQQIDLFVGNRGNFKASS